jgi:ubiquinone/menaquinone biosynthesis C-methylase UbiE
MKTDTHSKYSKEEIQKTYQQVHDLLVTKYIIKKYSTNKKDIRHLAIEGLNLSDVKYVLDLGCGYGFFIEILADRLHREASIVGIDLVENNREAYFHTVSSIGYRGDFINNDVEIINTFPQGSYDLIIASFSLYFFPHIINHIARILSPGGIFIAITHSRRSLKEIIEFVTESMQDIGITPPKSISIEQLLTLFSQENGEGLLKDHFKNIESIEYSNSMKFSVDTIDDCIYYIEKKKQLLYKEVMIKHPERVLDLEISVIKRIYEKVQRDNDIIITKDDAIFRCYNPIV